MARTAFAQAAITAFLEPGGFGELFVWRISAEELMDLCATHAKFDPHGSIETLILGGCSCGEHPGREALEDHFRTALASPESPECLASGSAVSRRAESLVGSTLACFDFELGFLDLLIHVPSASESLPKSILRSPAASLCKSFAATWGAQPIYCGSVLEDEWKTYHERALAVLALIERSEIEESTGGRASSSGSRRL